MNFASFNRRTAPKVRDGNVQRKNRHRSTTTLGYVVGRESPSKGFRHVVTKSDIHRFVGLIPDWPTLCEGLERILLSRGDAGKCADSYYEHFRRERTAMIALQAWRGDLWKILTDGYFAIHAHVLHAIGVVTTEERDGYRCHFSESQAKAFLLLHVFMHELGHHHDRMRWKQKSECRGGELYAEEFANARFAAMLPKYVEAFGDPAFCEQA
jgi:hypothetical protein